MTVLLLGTTGFPFGSATIQRQIQIAKALKNAGCNVRVLNNRSPHAKEVARKEKIVTKGTYQNIKYFYSSLFSYRPKNFLIRNLAKNVGVLLEFLAILYYRVFKNAKHLIYRTDSLKSLKYYYKIAKLLKMELIYDYVEFYDALGQRGENDVSKLETVFDYEFYKYTHKIIVISNFLEEHVNSLKVKKPLLKIPPIIDFTYFDSIKTKEVTQPFFLFCGSASYDDVIKFIISSYAASNAKNKGFNLKLVINGKQQQLEGIQQYIDTLDVKNNINILSKIPYVSLVELYKTASALLIPITNNVQDQARFPFKICEYVAAKKPVITSDSGAIIEFFTDNKNALIAETDNLDDYSSKIRMVANNSDLAINIGKEGYKLGQRVFNYTTYSQPILNFLNTTK